MIKFFAGIDVQVKRGCCYYIINDSSKYITNGWVNSDSINNFPLLFSRLTKGKLSEIAIGIDAPRMPLINLRKKYFDRKTSQWITKQKKSIGRECEVIINSYKLANCQWTNTIQNSHEWMKLGYELFSSLKEFEFLFEVFPSASYKMFEDDSVSYELCLREFKPGIKDMLDASVAAITVKEFIEGNGCEVGGGDGLGTIILPRKIKDW